MEYSLGNGHCKRHTIPESSNLIHAQFLRKVCGERMGVIVLILHPTPTWSLSNLDIYWNCAQETICKMRPGWWGRGEGKEQWRHSASSSPSFEAPVWWLPVSGKAARREINIWCISVVGSLWAPAVRHLSQLSLILLVLNHLKGSKSTEILLHQLSLSPRLS